MTACRAEQARVAALTEQLPGCPGTAGGDAGETPPAAQAPGACFPDRGGRALQLHGDRRVAPSPLHPSALIPRNPPPCSSS